MCDIVVNKFTFAISSPDEFLFCRMTPQKFDHTESVTLCFGCDAVIKLHASNRIRHATHGMHHV